MGFGLGQDSKLAYDPVTDTVDIQAANVTKNGAPLGGSSFAHLTEDAPNSRLVADWELVSTTSFNLRDALGSPTKLIEFSPGHLNFFTALASDEAFYLSTLDDSYPRLRMLADGSLHWGAGVAAPDTSLKRYAPGVLQVQSTVPDNYLLLGPADFTTDSLWFGVNGIQSWRALGTDEAFKAGTNADSEARVRVLNNGSVNWGGGTVAPDVRLGRAPGGPQLVIQAPGGTGPSMWFDIADPQGGSVYAYSTNGQAGFNGAGGFATTLDAALEVEAFVAQMSGNTDWGFNLYNNGTNWKLGFGTGVAAKDVFVGRSAADVFAVGLPLEPDALEMYELAADAAAPATNGVRLYSKDVGGKTALFARFPTGAVQQIAIEP